MKPAWILYFTAGSMPEARRIAQMLIRQRRAACVNILGGIQSVYRWAGAIETEREVAVLAKTSAARVQEVIRTIRKAHSYDVPCIVAWPLIKGYPPFLRWISQETRAAAQRPTPNVQPPAVKPTARTGERGRKPGRGRLGARR